jgi:glyoxylase-like metal-dependent hydrolase (beta-lactamase superfamily II)
MILHQKSRTVHLLWLGNGHTDGDVFVYLPKEKFIAGGDALHGWVPFMADSYPHDWIKTLGEVAKLDVEHLVGGHGGVMSAKAQIELWRNYLTDLMNETAAAYASGATMPETISQVVKTLTGRYNTRFPDFANRVPGNVEKAYRVISGSTN